MDPVDPVESSACPKVGASLHQTLVLQEWSRLLRTQALGEAWEALGSSGSALGRSGWAHEAQFLHQWGPYESYGGIRTTIRRRISIRIFLDRSPVQLKPLLHQKSRKSKSRLLIWARRGGVSEEFSRRCTSTVKSG